MTVTAAALASTALPLGPAFAQEKGGTLVMIVQPEAPSLASYLSTAAPTCQVATKIYDGLLEYSFDLQPLPSLAESWEQSADGKTIRFNLRKGVKFHDGKPFTSADVKFSIMEVLKKFHTRGPITFREVTEIETPDEHTVILKLANAAPYLMMGLSGYESPMVPMHHFDPANVRESKLANEPVGTGPFKFVEWKRGQYVRLDKNPDYWKEGLPLLDRIVVRFIADSGTRTAAIEKGEAHVAGMAAIFYSDVRMLEKNPEVEVTTKGYEMISPQVEIHFNVKQAPFDNKKVRQAIAYALDRRYIIDNVWFGFGRPATGPIHSNFKSRGLYTDEVKNYNVPDGIEQANRLLDEAGFPRGADGIRFEITHDMTPYGEEWRRLGEYTAQVFEKIGIKTNLRYEDVPTWLKRIYTDYDFQMTSTWVSNLADPVLGIHREYHSNSIRPGVVFVNCSRWSSPRTDELMNLATVEVDPKKRGALYKEFQQIVVEEVPTTWLHELQFSTVHRKDVEDLIISPLGVFSSFDRARLAK